MANQPRIGGLESIEDMRTAIRDLEKELSRLISEVSEDAATTFVLVRKADGTLDRYDLVSLGGCTITKDDANRRITISVP